MANCYIVMCGTEVLTATRNAKTAAAAWERIARHYDDVTFYDPEHPRGYRPWTIGDDEKANVKEIARQVRAYARAYLGTAFEALDEHNACSIQVARLD